MSVRIAGISRAGLMLGAGVLLAVPTALAQAPAPAEETPEMFPAGPNRDEAFSMRAMRPSMPSRRAANTMAASAHS